MITPSDASRVDVLQMYRRNRAYGPPFTAMQDAVRSYAYRIAVAVVDGWSDGPAQTDLERFVAAEEYRRQIVWREIAEAARRGCVITDTFWCVGQVGGAA